jgi:acid stress-induced BolA-like protein IbaG/YrbA
VTSGREEQLESKMALQILSAPSDPQKLAGELREAIESAIAGAKVEVSAGGAGHFEIEVTSATFDGKSRVKQQQSVYAAIAHLMKGDAAPVHAIDRLQTHLP